MPGGYPAWYVTRYDEVRAAFSDPRLSRDRVHWKAFHEGRIPMSPEVVLTSGETMFTADPPAHTRLRALVSKAFTARRIELLRPRMAEIAGELVADIAEAGTADLVRDLATPLPLTVVCDLFGVPEEDRARLRDWTDALVTSDGVEDAGAAYAALTGYLDDLTARKRAEPGDDLTSDLVRVRADGSALTHKELVDTLTVMVTAGHETTLNLIGNGAFALLTHPEHLEAARRDPERWPAVVEEVLRWEGSLVHTIFRYTTEDVELGGVRVPAGEAVVLSMAAADRDPRRFPRPDTFDPAREDRGHLAFGHGLHYCIGAPLARAEAQVALPALFTRLDVAPAAPPGTLAWRRSPVSRGLVALPVTVSRR
ncbi:cytochrome P450 [Streptomyces capparidis]